MSIHAVPSTSVATRIEQGVQAVKQGDHDRAFTLFAAALHADPQQEAAWLWLSAVVGTDAERRYCLEQVVAITPDHRGAQLGLAYLTPEVGSRSPLLAAPAPLPGSCTTPGCTTSVARPGHTLCYAHWKARQAEGALRPAAHRPSLITASLIGEQSGLAGPRVNLLLAELGWISRDEQGWRVTPHGAALGGVQQVHQQSGVPFAIWPTSIVEHPILQATIASYRGEGLAGMHPGAAPTGGFRERWPAQHRTTDGHWVRSKAEVIIDNWLYMAGIAHAYERQLPIVEELYCDFYLPAGKVYLEYWGLEQDAAYAERKRAKQAVYARYQFQLIDLTDAHIRNLDDHLPQLLLPYGVRVG